jgi:CO/xanthine dehydrogenase Mo-binding subunit
MPIDAVEGQRDLYGDDRVVLIPLPGHTPGTIGALVNLDRSGAFLLASDSISLRANYDRNVIPRNTWSSESTSPTSLPPTTSDEGSRLKAHALRVHLQGLASPDRALHTQSTPPNAGTKHLAQVVAQELGVRVGDVKIVHGDSAAVAHGTGTYASRSAVLAGGAAILASRAVREKVVKIAAHLLEAPENEIETADGEISVPGTNRKMTFAELGRAVHSDIGRLPKEVREELEATKLYDPFFGTASTAAHIAQVEIDPETYVVTVQHYVVAEDCGRMINPLIVEGQVHGGVAQGIGAALLEEVIHDEQGQALTASLVDYLIPSATEIPHIGVAHVESESPSTLGGLGP